MQLTTEHTNLKPMSAQPGFIDTGSHNSRFSHYKVIRRNGSVVAFEPGKISVALTKAFIAVDGGQGAASVRVREVVASLTTDVVNALLRRQPDSGTFHIEDIQDQVELALMRSGEHDVARAYVLYREDRARERAKLKQKSAAEAAAARAAAASKDADEKRRREEAERSTQLAEEQRKRNEEARKIALEQAEKNRIAAEQADAAKMFTDIATAVIGSRQNNRR